MTEVSRGRCDPDYGVFGRTEDYGTMKIGNDGRAHTAVTTRERTPTSGDYFVVVYASVANPNMVVACGNLLPPTR